MTALTTDLGPAKLSDLEGILAIEKASFPFPWTEGMFLSELLDNRFSSSFVARETHDGQMLGYVFVKTLFDELHLLNIAVDPAWRRRGIGKTLIQRALSLLWEKGMERAILEVRVSNRPALDLYRKFGFKEIGLRRNYYCRPTEHALLLQYEVGANGVLKERLTT